MRTTQTKFLKTMDEVAESFNLEAVVDYSCANVGVLRFESKDSFDPRLEFSFNFQLSYASFKSDRLLPKWGYTKNEDLNEFVETVKAALTA